MKRYCPHPNPNKEFLKGKLIQVKEQKSGERFNNKNNKIFKNKNKVMTFCISRTELIYLVKKENNKEKIGGTHL